LQPAWTSLKKDLLDIDSLRRAFAGVDTLFLLNAVTGDEFTEALITLNVAREAGIDRVVYLSGFDADKAVNVPHFAVKFGAERMPETLGFSATILRSVYPTPIGSKWVAMVDARDIAEIAAIELIRRDRASGKLPVKIINIVGPDILTGADVAAIWTEVLGRPIAYGGDDPGGFEASMANFMPVWMAYEMRIMAERYVSDGMIPQEGDRERLVKMPGRNLQSYRETALAG